MLVQITYLKTPPLDKATRTRALTSGKAGRVVEALKSVAPVLKSLCVRMCVSDQTVQICTPRAGA